MNNYNFTWLEKASYLLKNVRGLLVPIKLVAHVKKIHQYRFYGNGFIW